MKHLNNVVLKLWITIIGLVALVLIINSLLLGRFIDNNVANSKDQVEALQKLAQNISKQLSMHFNDDRYFQAMNDLLGAQQAAMILVDSELQESAVSSPASGGLARLKASEIFTVAQLDKVFDGGTVERAFRVSGESQPYQAVAVPQEAAGKVKAAGAVVIYQKQAPLENTQAYFKRLFIYAIVIGFLLTTFFAFFLSSRITQPLLQMKKAADQIASGNYSTRVPVLSLDEIGQLANTFNHMTERLDETVHALNHEKENLSSILSSMADAVITFDAQGRIILTNPLGNKIVQEWSAIQWADDEHPVSGFESEPLLPEPLRPLYEAILEENPNKLHSKLHVHNGVWSVVMAPLYSDNAVRGAVAVLRDVTEEHRLEKLRKDFVANVSHELRTPLSMLQGYSEALLDDIAASPEERQELAQVIHDESLRMGRLVKDLLDLARMEAGHLELHFREVDVSGLVRRVYRKFSALCKEREIQLHLEMQPEPLELQRADEDRLEQVLTNLLDNAIRHTPGGASITIRAQQVQHKQRPAILLEIEDQGQGIPAEDLPYIFERFYKADKARTRGTGGTGLGLAIVKNIVDSHQGTAMVGSALGKGTTFSIILPDTGPTHE
ncbi:HAMP domain-containing sensor histidine kinase [Paenibacillus sp. y28]|uniref:HAMP domain-containing sensor histidine kinase n=1 Tax=Paenibacillus sp. y28 TaxID=3129110 RepID=UPI0030173D2A